MGRLLPGEWQNLVAMNEKLVRQHWAIVSGDGTKIWINIDVSHNTDEYWIGVTWNTGETAKLFGIYRI